MGSDQKTKAADDKSEKSDQQFHRSAATVLEKEGMFTRGRIPLGKIGEGAFSDALQTLNLRNGKCCACKHMKQHFESFLGSNELDQISKIHDIIGTPAKTTLKKFKQSRSFSFDLKNGEGKPPLVHKLTAKGFSLLYAMIKYDPD